jgi:hypothetical protein
MLLSATCDRLGTGSCALQGLASWDRGFDSTDNQVWGAEKGGYIFKKLP